MGEYQYYEFQAIDRPLTPAEQQKVASLSSRVDAHPTRAVHQGREAEYEARLRRLREMYLSRRALLRRLDEAGLS